MRLIDAERLEKRLLSEEPNDGWDEFHEGFDRMKGIALNAIDATPTIDAVPVVRCGECRWFADNNGGNWFGCQMFNAIRLVPEDAPKENDYCSYGVKMESEGST